MSHKDQARAAIQRVADGTGSSKDLELTKSFTGIGSYSSELNSSARKALEKEAKRKKR